MIYAAAQAVGAGITLFLYADFVIDYLQIDNPTWKDNNRAITMTANTILTLVFPVWSLPGAAISILDSYNDLDFFMTYFNN